MRKINTGDVVKCARILKYSGMREKLIDLFKQGQGIQATDINAPEVQEFGVKVIFEIIELLAEQRAEREIYELLAGILEKTPEQIEAQEITQTITDIKAIARENDLKGFFSQVSNMIALK